MRLTAGASRLRQQLDGTGFSEGVGLLLLERLSDARHNGHKVLALVRGSAVNQDGASNGLTAPHGPSQERVIRDALSSAGLSAADVDVVEAHGTGTRLGDPIEAQALLATYGQNRSRGPLWLGSLKSNIGHTQAAAGVAGAIKIIQAFQHDALPRTLHIDAPSTNVDWLTGAVSLLTEQVPWPRNGAPRRAGLSSFGISGTNAHVILEEPPPLDAPAASPVTPPEPLPFIITASSPDALTVQASRLQAHLRENPHLELYDVAAALALRRAHLTHRIIALARDRAELDELLTAAQHSNTPAGLICGRARRDGKVAFMFSGQGSQWAGMGKELYEAFPVFAEALDSVSGELNHHLPRPLEDVLFPGDDSSEAALLDETQFTQAALFALEVALYSLTTSFGMTPHYLIGHSIGEISAVFAAGALSLTDACTLVGSRGRLMGALATEGAMVAVQASEQEALESIHGLEDHMSLAAANGPTSVVISGEKRAILQVERAWREKGRKTQHLQVSNAFHSPLMDGMCDELTRIAGGLTFSQPTIPIISNVTGQPLAIDDLNSGEYWARQVRETVRFYDGIRFLDAAGSTRYVELAPIGSSPRWLYSA